MGFLGASKPVPTNATQPAQPGKIHKYTGLRWVARAKHERITQKTSGAPLRQQQLCTNTRSRCCSTAYPPSTPHPVIYNSCGHTAVLATRQCVAPPRSSLPSPVPTPAYGSFPTSPDFASGPEGPWVRNVSWASPSSSLLSLPPSFSCTGVVFPSVSLPGADHCQKVGAG